MSSNELALDFSGNTHVNVSFDGTGSKPPAVGVTNPDPPRACVYEFWFGQAPLWQVFWPYFTALNLLMFAIDTLTKAGFVTVLL